MTMLRQYMECQAFYVLALDISPYTTKPQNIKGRDVVKMYQQKLGNGTVNKVVRKSGNHTSLNRYRLPLVKWEIDFSRDRQQIDLQQVVCLTGPGSFYSAIEVCFV